MYAQIKQDNSDIINVNVIYTLSLINKLFLPCFVFTKLKILIVVLKVFFFTGNTYLSPNIIIFLIFHLFKNIYYFLCRLFILDILDIINIFLLIKLIVIQVLLSIQYFHVTLTGQSLTSPMALAFLNNRPKRSGCRTSPVSCIIRAWQL